MSISTRYLISIMFVFVICAVVAIIQPSQAIIVIGMGGTIIAVFVNGLNQASQTKEVATALINSTTNTTTKLDEIHTLVNSAMGTQLKSNADLARWKANNTKQLIDIQIAENAELALKQHIQKQNIVDLDRGRKE